MNRFYSTTVLFLMAICLPTICLPSQTLMGQMPEFPEPSENHKLLHKEAGTWDAKVKLFIPGSEPMESKGVETNEVVCNGLWVRSHFKSGFMGQTFEGSGMFGYNPDTKKYIGYWGDNMSSHPSTMVGEYDEDSNTFTYMVKGIDPGTGEETEAKHVIVWKDDNTRVFTLYDGDAKMMEVEYKKRAEKSSGSSKR